MCTSRTQTRPNQQRNERGSRILRERWISQSDSKINVKDEQRSNHLEVQERMRPNGTALYELHEDAKCRVPNNMIEIYVVTSMDYVMCRGRGSLEEYDEQTISAR